MSKNCKILNNDYGMSKRGKCLGEIKIREIDFQKRDLVFIRVAKDDIRPVLGP
jgi:hypothetical protein